MIGHKLLMKISCVLVKNLLTQWDTEEENQTNQSVKNLLTQMGLRGGKPLIVVEESNNQNARHR